MATIYEVSALAGVSLSSVSRVLNDHEHVSEKTKKKVMAAMAELEYRPNSVARSLASSRSDSIGVLVSELHGPFFGDMLSSIELALRNAGKHAVITAGHSDEESEKEGLDFLIDRNCDALILLVDAMSDDDLITLSRKKIPFVILNRNIPEIRGNCFYLDNELGGYLAAKHLIECGHKDIAYISGPLSKQDSTERFTGHKKALIEAKIPFNKALFYEGDYLTQSGRDGINDFIKNKVLFTAVACANDEMASGAMRGARDNNIDIPSDCSIIGFDNAYFTEYLFPQLSTINNPIKAMAKMSTQWILKNVYKQKDLDIKNLFSPELIKRESVVKVLAGIKK
ncbi:LacI family DNA-binding transcriptional regulator [Colwellia sp. 12G3]|uniref:LacI family DNA-binding transcriptional regulator n=1 Tax=Colwellia sp. 12G3 TaxID=2058299 RepID=UPI000C335E62|nr:LacI family DNA-binding transcriptional regulator [Colwellia sp. 12G3]PKI13877.1 LacI family transcriptional regulator [Colwellia sp. 12G3]